MQDFLRYLKKMDSREYYNIVYLNAASKSTGLIESESLFNHFFIRTNCRMCNRRTKWLVNEKRYYSFCSLKCKSKWLGLANKKPLFEEDDLLAIKMGVRFRKKHPKDCARMKKSFYEKSYAKIKQVFMEEHDIFNRYNLGKFTTRKFYFFVFGRSGIKFCKFCNAPTKWHPLHRRFNDYCSTNCSNGDLRHKRRHGNMNSSR